MLICLVVNGVACGADAAEGTKPLRAGIIGLDTSHVIAFTKLLNDPDAKGDLADVTVVAGYPGGSPDVPASADRVEKFTEQLRGMGIEICDTIPELIEKVDVVLLESVDGRPHLEQVRPVFAAGKPVFIDKPLAGSLADAIQIAGLSKHHNVPFFSCSSTRFSSGFQAVRNGTSPLGKARSCTATSPMSIEPHHPDLFWYGIHGVEILFTVMGTGCETVTREAENRVVGVWADGRRGTFIGQSGYTATVEGTKATGPAGKYEGYGPLVGQIARFFKTGQPPVSVEEMLEIYTFMEAADESKRQGGKPVKMEEVLRKAVEAAAGFDKEVMLPPPAVPMPVEPKKRIVVQVAAGGEISLDGTAVCDDDLVERLTTARNRDEKLGVLIRADGKLPYENVVRAIDACSKAGFRDVQIAIRKAEAKE